MSWRPVESGELEGLKDFLLEHEVRGVNATALLYQGGSKAKWPSGRFAKFFRHPGPGTAFGGVVAFRGQTTYIPIVPEKTFLEPFPFKGNPGRHFSFLGPRTWTDWLNQGTEITPYKVLDYQLMTTNSPPLDPKSPPAGWEIHKAGPGDRDLLFPLQAAYEKEEVVFSPEEFEPWACYHNLKNLLQREQIWYIQDENYVPRAKAGTNAVGYKWCQLGGIYTDLNFRRRGLAEILLSRILELLTFRGYGLSLFVKNQNGPALSLYEKLGFQVLEDFQISYFTHP